MQGRARPTGNIAQRPAIVTTRDARRVRHADGEHLVSRGTITGVFPVSRTPLAAYLENAAPFASGAVSLVDAAGEIVASNLAETAILTSLDAESAGLHLAGGCATSEAPGSRVTLIATAEAALAMARRLGSGT